MTRRYIVGMVTAILTLWGLALEASAGSKWDLVLYVGITHPVAQYFKEFAGEVKKRTRGELEIVVRPSGELPYKITEIARVVGQGQIQLGDGYSGFIAGDSKIASLPSLPFLVTTAAELRRAMEVLEPHVTKDLERFGDAILFWYTFPPQNIWGRGKPMMTIADFKGRKIRTNSPEATEMLRRLGAIPVTFATAEVATAAQRGAIDAVITAGFNLLGAKWYEFTEWGFVPDINIGGPSYILVNKKALDALAPDARSALQAVAREYQERMLREIPLREEQDRKTLETAHKIRIVRPPAAESAKGRALMAPYWDQWAKELGPAAGEALAGVRKILGK